MTKRNDRATTPTTLMATMNRNGMTRAGSKWTSKGIEEWPLRWRLVDQAARSGLLLGNEVPELEQVKTRKEQPRDQPAE